MYPYRIWSDIHQVSKSEATEVHIRYDLLSNWKKESQIPGNLSIRKLHALKYEEKWLSFALLGFMQFMKQKLRG